MGLRREMSGRGVNNYGRSPALSPTPKSKRESLLNCPPEDRQGLVDKAAGIDPETLRQICVFDPADLVAPDQEPDSTENR